MRTEKAHTLRCGGKIVVGVDGSHGGRALEFGTREAAFHEARLRVVLRLADSAYDPRVPR